jgi:hypothetical protein
MDFQFTKEQEMLKTEIRRFAEEKLGPFAQAYVTYAKTDSDQGTRGISAFVGDKGTPGFEGKPMKLMGPHPIGELTFADCRIPRDNLLGEPGKGMRIAKAMSLKRPLSATWNRIESIQPVDFYYRRTVFPSQAAAPGEVLQT